MNLNMITGIINEGFTQQTKTASLQPGQIIHGKIMKLFPNGIAALKAGAQTIIAQLEAPLEANKSYWLQVQPGEGKPRLKVLGNAGVDGKNNVSLNGVLNELSIPATEENQTVIRFFVKEQLPVNKDFIQQSVQLLKETNFSQTGMEAIKLLSNKGLPLTNLNFLSVMEAMANEPFSLLLERLGELLSQHPSTGTGSELAQFVKSLKNIDPKLQALLDIPNDQADSAHRSQTLSEGVSLAHFFKDLMKGMGYSYEHEVSQFLKHYGSEAKFSREELKPLLIDFLNESQPDTLKEAADKILHKITGFQLLAQETGPLQQLAVQIPIMLDQKSIDLTMQWSGRRQENGQIDPAFCRVLFYLELKHLQDTIVDMQVQNRIIRITVINENVNLKQMAEPFILHLKEQLHSMGYILSSVGFNTPFDKQEKNRSQAVPSLFDTKHYSGVDLRI